MAAIPTWSEDQIKAGIDTKTFYSDGKGNYGPARHAIHDKIVDAKLAKHRTQSNPQLILVSGGTASGKTSAADKALDDIDDAIYVNTDEIRAKLPEFKFVEGTDQAGLLQEEAGDIRDQILTEASLAGLNVVLDAPGSPYLADSLKKIERRGYQIEIAYTHRPVAEAKIAAKHRAENAKNPADRRRIPESVIEASHRKARAGLNAMAEPKRQIVVYDKTGKNIGEPANVIYHRTFNGEVRINQHAQMALFAKDGEPQIDLTLF